MFKRGVAGAAVAAVMTMSGTAFAQSAPAQTSDEQMRAARRRVATMEAILERAVSFGADQVIVQVRDIMGGDQPRLLGAPRVRGFRLDGTGVIFYVDVPSLQVPILWPVRYLVDDANSTNATLAELRLFARQLDPASRTQLESFIAQLQARSGPPDRLRQNVAAASIAPEAVRPREPAPAAAPPPIEDPQAEYRKQVKAALIDAVLENTASVLIGRDEWLTIAARSNVARDPLFPGDTVGSTTWVARVKGSTLADVRAQRITPAEARTLVEEQEQ